MLGDEAIALLAIDCHPWHGSLGLSALTAAEVDADGLLADPSEMAAWRHHYFTRDLAAWQSTANLGSEMRAAYASGDRSAMAEEFLAACAAAMASESVVAAIEKLNLVRGFRVSVTHPDTGRDFSKSQQKFFGEQD